MVTLVRHYLGLGFRDLAEFKLYLSEKRRKRSALQTYGWHLTVAPQWIESRRADEAAAELATPQPELELKPSGHLSAWAALDKLDREEAERRRLEAEAAALPETEPEPQPQPDCPDCNDTGRVRGSACRKCSKGSAVAAEMERERIVDEQREQYLEWLKEQPKAVQYELNALPVLLSRDIDDREKVLKQLKDGTHPQLKAILKTLRIPPQSERAVLYATATV